MSKFLKALQRAEEERLLHEQPWRDPSEEEFIPPPLEEPAFHPEQPPPRLRPLGWDFSTPPPEEGARVEPHCVSLLQPATFEAEQYRTLRYMVERARNASGALQVVALSSPDRGDGKTTTAINLAGALAQAAEVQVLVIDANLRQPAVARFLGLHDDAAPGLVDAVLNPTLGLHDVVRVCPRFHLSVLPAGRATTAPYEILKAPRMGELLAEARRRYDYLVLDTPPLVPFPDCRLIGQWVDGFFVIVMAHKTSRKLVKEALTVVEPAQLLGLVLNRDTRPQPQYRAHPRVTPPSEPRDTQPQQHGNGRSSLWRGVFAASATPQHTSWE
jgi:capsular exopolysaccharide synthesis family protein